MHHHRRSVLLLATTVIAVGLALAPGAVARRAKPTACPDGRFVLPQGSAPLIEGLAVDTDAVAVAGGTVTIDSGCGATTARVRARRKGTKVTARWASCGAVESVRLKANIVAPACEQMSGKLKTKGARPIRFEATREAGTGVTTTTTTTTLAGPQRTGLDALYALRDEVLAPTARGQHYIDLFNAHNTTMLAWLMHGEGLYEFGAPAFLAWMPAFEALVNGRGDTVTITAEQIAGLEGFFSRLSTFVTPEFAQTIADELAAVPPATLVGLTMVQARDAVLSVPVITAQPTGGRVTPRGGGGCVAVCLVTGECNY